MMGVTFVTPVILRLTLPHVKPRNDECCDELDGTHTGRLIAAGATGIGRVMAEAFMN